MRRLAARERGGDDGFTIVEMMVALLVFAIVASGLIATLSTVLDITRSNRNRSVAAYLGTRELERARRMSFQELVDNPDVTTPDGLFDIRRQTEPVSTGEDTTCATSGTADTPAALRVTATITWDDMGPVRPVRNDTMITPAYGSAQQTTGSVLVNVQLAGGNAAAGRTVALTSSSGAVTARSGTTSDAGCVLFPFLPTGDYTVAVGGSTMIDADQASPPAARTVNVGIGRTTAVTVQVDQPGRVQPALGPGYPAHAQLPTGVLVTASNTSGSTGAIAGSGVTGTTVPGTWPSFALFPFTTAYQLWAGTCTDSLVTSGAATVTVRAGQTSPATLRLATVAVTATNPRSDRTYRLIASHAADGGCPSGESFTFDFPASGSSQVLTAAVPFGTWTFTVWDVTANRAFGASTRTLSPPGTTPVTFNLAAR